MPVTSRPFKAISSMLSRVIMPERAAVVVCTVTASAWTVIVSATPPTSSAIARSANPFGRRERDPFLFVGLESVHRHAEVELPGEQIREDERSVAAGDRLAGQIGARVFQYNGGAWKHAAAGVGDRTGNLAGQSLCLHGTHRPGERDEQRGRQSDPAKTRYHVALLPALIKVRRFPSPRTRSPAGCPFRFADAQKSGRCERLRPAGTGVKWTCMQKRLFGVTNVQSCATGAFATDYNGSFSSATMAPP